MGLTSSPIDWYAARAAGIVAYLILTAVVLVGLTLSGQLRLPQWPKFAVTDVHRFGGLLVGVFVSIHVATIALDSYTPFSPAQLVVPFTSHYRPLWTALGIVAIELLVAIAVTNVLRNRIPYRWWRRIHVLNFVVWAAATVHGVGAGTDSRSLWMVLLYVVSVSGVLAALAWRLGRRSLAPRTVQRVALAAGVLGLGAVLALASTAPGRTTHRAPVPAPPAFADAFTGSLAQQNGLTGSMLTILGRGTGARPVRVRLDLVTTDGRTITDTALQLEDISTGSICSGTVSSVSTSGFSGRCSFAGGPARTVDAVWQLSGGQVSGRLSVQA